jgi:K+-transporting ATPase ATPase C chain
MFTQLKPAILITIVFTALTGLIYPLTITGICQVVFPRTANGSLVERKGHVIGSRLIAQRFARPEYFHPRPSAAGVKGYDATNSGGSNLATTNPALADRLRKDATAFRENNPSYTGPIPVDAITTSASGLDPDITPENALAQSSRVAEARHVPLDRVNDLLRSHVQRRTLGFIGEPVVNVLELNLALDTAMPLK